MVATPKQIALEMLSMITWENNPIGTKINNHGSTYREKDL
jgi:hypothetical protein